MTSAFVSASAVLFARLAGSRLYAVFALARPKKM
jgi:hypothetical protein